MKAYKRSKKKTKPNKPSQSSTLKQLLRDFFASLKEDKIFGKLIANYQPLTPYLYQEEDIKYRTSASITGLYATNITLAPSEGVTYRLRVKESDKFCETLASKLYILKSLLIRKDRNKPCYTYQFLNSFIKYYCKQHNIKAHSNPMLFQMWFGGFFALMTYLLIVGFIWLTLGLGYALTYGALTTLVVLLCCSQTLT